MIANSEIFPFINILLLAIKKNKFTRGHEVISFMTYRNRDSFITSRVLSLVLARYLIVLQYLNDY